jgi:hypothetical protein
MYAKALMAACSLSLCIDAAQAETGAEAASNEPSSSRLAVLPDVTVTGHYDNAIGTSDAASQGVVRGALLQDVPLLRPGEALETVPGLVVTQHSGDGKANQYFLRGYNLDHGTDFATSLDGVPVNMPTSAHGQGYADLNYLIPELVSRIDYRKGPYFADKGDFSSAGSADIQYRNRLDRSIADLSVGAHGYRRALMAGSTRLSGADQDLGAELLGALEVMNNNGPWTVGESLNKTNALLRLSDGGIANGWAFDAIHYDAKWNATDQVPLELINSGQLGRYSSMDPSDGGNTGRDILSGEWHDNDANGYTRVAAFAEHYRLQLWSNFTFFNLRPATGDQFAQAENRNLVGGQVVRGWSHSLFGRDSITELGLRLRHDSIDVSLQNTRARVPLATVSNNRIGVSTAGLYLQNTTAWNSWLRTTAGLREDAVAMEMTSYTLPQNSGAASSARISPKLSVILGPWQQTELFFNAGRGFHSNDARGVINKVDPVTGAPATLVPALAAGAGREVGLRTEIIDGLQSSLALWRLDSDSEIVYSADAGGTSPKGASKRYGLEWNNHWTASRLLLIDADFAWTHARYAQMNDNGNVGNLIPNAVSRVALLRAAIRDVGPWSGGVETRYIGAYPLAQDGSLTAPSAIVTHLRIRRELSADVGISFDLLNVFNRQYYDIAYQQAYQVSPTSLPVPGGITVHPGEPRQLRMTLGFRF